MNFAYVTGKMVSRSLTVRNKRRNLTNKRLIKKEAVSANTKKAAKFGWQVLHVKLDPFKPKFIDETCGKAFGYKCKYIVRKL